MFSLSRQSRNPWILVLSLLLSSPAARAQVGGGAILPLPIPIDLPVIDPILIDPIPLPPTFGTLIDFDDLSPGAIVSDQFAAQGVLFDNGPIVRGSSPVTSVTTPNVVESPAVPDLPEHAGPLGLRFTAPVQVVSVFYGSRYGGVTATEAILRAYDAAGNEIARDSGSVPTTRRNVNVQLKVEVDSARITRVEVHYADQQSLDGVNFDIDRKGVETIDNLFFKGDPPPPPPSNEPPVVHLARPLDGETFFGDFDIPYGGTVSDDRGIASLRLKVEYLDDSSAPIDVPLEFPPSTTSFSFPRFDSSMLQLRPGRNRITITARDTRDVEASDSVVVSYGPAPVVTITEPTDSESFTQTQVVVRGTIRKDLGRLRARDVRVQVKLGGSVFSSGIVDSLTGSAPEYRFEATVDVADAGPRTFNTIVVTATDEGGASAGDEVVVLIENPDRISARMVAVQAIEGAFLVAGRTTVARIHPFALAGDLRDVPALLHAFRDGTELPDSPILPQGRGLVDINQGDDFDEVHASLTKTWNFLLPPSWTAEGSLTLVGIVDPDDELEECGTCLENNTRELTVEFNASESLTVRPVRMRGLDMAGSIVEPTAAQASAAMRDIRRLMPYSTLTILPPLRAMNRPRPLNETSELLAALYDRFTCFAHSSDVLGWLGDRVVGCSWSTYFVGLVPGIRGRAALESPGGVSSLRTSTAAHELAHALGREHAGNGHDEAEGGGFDRFFPHPHGTVGGWGFDTMNWQVVRQDWPGGDAAVPGNLPDAGACDTDDTGCPTHDYLSYGNGPRWTSAYTWNKIFLHGFRGEVGSIFGLEGEEGGAGAGAGAPVTTDHVIHIRGHVTADGQVVTRSYYTLPTPANFFVLPEEGELEASTLDAGGRVLSTRTLAPIPISDSEEELFSFLLPFDDATALVRLSFGGEVVDERRVSASRPEIFVTTPANGGHVTSGGLLRIRWEGSDADGDRVTYAVQYSADKGESWTTLGTGLEETELTVDASTLEGSPNALVRIVGTDGVRTTRARSGFFTLEDQPPFVVVLWPEDGAELPADDRLIFQGSVADPESDEIVDGETRWFSDRQGFLGEGRTPEIQGLEEGRHRIRLEATDEAGNVGSASVEVYVGVEKPEPLGRSFLRGDVNGDGQIVLSDALQVLQFLFLGGAALPCEDAADTNDDGRLELTDGIQILNFLFLGTEEPRSPYPEPGLDPTDDALLCPQE